MTAQSVTSIINWTALKCKLFVRLVLSLHKRTLFSVNNKEENKQISTPQSLKKKCKQFFYLNFLLLSTHTQWNQTEFKITHENRDQSHCKFVVVKIENRNRQLYCEELHLLNICEIFKRILIDWISSTFHFICTTSWDEYPISVSWFDCILVDLSGNSHISSYFIT